MIVKPTYEYADEFEVTFLSCSKKRATANEKDIVDVPFDDIVARLPAPSVLNSKAHTKKMVLISFDLSQYRPL